MRGKVCTGNAIVSIGMRFEMLKIKPCPREAFFSVGFELFKTVALVGNVDDILSPHHSSRVDNMRTFVALDGLNGTQESMRIEI